MSVSPSKAMRPIRGVIPPVITPFTQTGEVSYKALVANLGQWNRTALAGYLILGSNSEFVYLSEEEKIRVLEVAREHIPADKVMIAGTGCEATEATITLTRRAAALGADFVMVVTPGYYKPLMRPRILIEHYRRVADASPIPVFLYNVPPFTGVVIDPRTVAQLAEHGLHEGMSDLRDLFVGRRQEGRARPSPLITQHVHGHLQPTNPKAGSDRLDCREELELLLPRLVKFSLLKE